jgi:hypothetical protein
LILGSGLSKRSFVSPLLLILALHIDQDQVNAVVLRLVNRDQQAWGQRFNKILSIVNDFAIFATDIGIRLEKRCYNFYV